MPDETKLPEITQLFLSATAQDCKPYRELVCNVLHKNQPKVKIFLQENWSGPVASVVNECEQKFKSCNAYFGLFGHRYGWKPPGYPASITELEFRWAVERWEKQDVPPIFILLPVIKSKADEQLKKWAQKLLKKEFPDEASRAAARGYQQTFLSEVIKWAAADGRLINYYEDQIDLIGKALSCIQNWNLEVLRKAALVGRPAEGKIPAQELGHIGRERQLQVLGEAIDALSRHDQERAITFLVHGPENHGQLQFAQFLSRWEDWEDSTLVFCGQALNTDSIDSLISWACAKLQVPNLGTATIEALAATLSARFARNSVVFIVQTLGRRPDRLATFLDQLWKPLVDALAACPPASKPRRLHCFVIDHEPLPDNDVPGIWRGPLDAGNVDYHSLLPLPPLGEIKDSDVRRWLKELNKSKIISVDEDLRETISQHVTQPDGIPPNVYNRLALEGFWA